MKGGETRLGNVTGKIDREENAAKEGRTESDARSAKLIQDIEGFGWVIITSQRTDHCSVV